MLGQGGTGPEILSSPLPSIFFQGNLGHSSLLLVDVIGSIVFLLSRCCLPNDGPAPPQIFCPRTAPAFHTL